MTTPPSVQNIENGLRVATDVTPPQTYDHKALIAEYKRVLPLRIRMRSVGIMQEMIAWVTLAFGCVLLHGDYHKPSFYAGLLFMPLACMVGGFFTFAVASICRPYLMKACFGTSYVCLGMLICSLTLLMFNLDVGQEYCIPPEATKCQALKFKSMARSRTNGIAGGLIVFTFLQLYLFYSVICNLPRIRIRPSFFRELGRGNMRGPHVNANLEVPPANNPPENPAQTTD